MKRFLFLLWSAVCVLPLCAQTDDSSRRREFDDAFMHAPADSLREDTLKAVATVPDAVLSLPLLPATPTPLFCSPLGYAWAPDYWGGTPWRLHEGMNAQVGMSLSVGLGKHAPSGVGFGQSLAMAYALPLNGRFTVAAGVYAHHMDWGGWRSTDAGVAGIVGYKVSDTVSLYAYGSKTFLPKENDLRFRHNAFPLYWGEPKERVGAAAEFKLGENGLIGVSVEHSSY